MPQIETEFSQDSDEVRIRVIQSPSDPRLQGLPSEYYHAVFVVKCYDEDGNYIGECESELRYVNTTDSVSFRFPLTEADIDTSSVSETRGLIHIQKISGILRERS